MSVSPFPLPPGTIDASTREEIIAYITSPAYANDLSLEQQIAVVAALAAATPTFTTEASQPDVGAVGDRWIDSSSNYQENVCVSPYISGAGVSGDWQGLHDAEAKATADGAASTAASASQITISSYPHDPPDGYTLNWIWVDSGDNNQPYVCTATYAAGLTVPNRHLKFDPLQDSEAQLLAAAAQGTADSKTETFYQDTSPEVADAADRWADTDNSNATYICTSAYTKVDWDNDVGGAQGMFANRHLYGDSFWTEINDATARATATSATALANINTTTFRGADFPAAGETSDGFLNTTTDQLYICNNTYNATLPIVDRESKWDRSADPVAYKRADDAYSLADGKIEVFILDDIPAAADYKDQWFDSNDGYKAYICKLEYASGGTLATNWDAITDSSKSQTYSQDEIPPAANLSDLWVDTDLNNKTFVCIQAYTTGGSVGTNWQSIADNKKVIFYGGDPPAVADIGDGWMDTVTVRGNFQFYLCGASYTADGHGYVDEVTTGVWKPAKDREAQANASSAFSLADQKSSTYYQDGLPDAADLGDQWVDTDDTYEDTGLNKAYVCTDGYTSGNGTQAKWTEYSDPVATKIATDALAAAENKRSVFRSGDTSPETGWPGPAGGAGGIPVDDWTSVGGAKIGDIWINIHPTTDEIQQRVCIEAYTGIGILLGNTSNWKSMAEDGLMYTEYVSKTNAAAQTVVSDVTFNGSTVSIANSLEALYGGTISAPGVPPSNGSAANKQYVIDQINLLVAGAPPLLNTLYEIAAAINNDDEVWETLSDLITPNTAHRVSDGKNHSDVVANTANKVAKAGDTMTGNLTVNKANPLVIQKLLTNTGTDVGGMAVLDSDAAQLMSVQASPDAPYARLVSNDANIGADLNSKRIQNVKDPAVDQDAATKKYVDDASGAPIIVGTSQVAPNTNAANSMIITLPSLLTTNWNASAFNLQLQFGGRESGANNTSISGVVTWSKSAGTATSNYTITGSAESSHSDSGGIIVYGHGDLPTTNTMGTEAIIYATLSNISSVKFGVSTSVTDVRGRFDLTASNNWNAGYPHCSVHGVIWLG